VGILTLCIVRTFSGSSHQEAHPELVGESPLHAHTGSERLAIEGTSRRHNSIECNGDQAGSGLVIKNPFLNKPTPSIGEDGFSRFIRLIRESKLLLCALRDWHNPGTLLKTYRLTSIEACWIEHFCAFHLLCDWD
jgi:hypothetical protein